MNTAYLEKQAIKAAMSGTWKEAIRLNKEILKQQPQNIAALNRLGRAFWETGHLKRARQTFKKVIEVDQYNPIALKNLKRLTDSGKIKKPPLKKSPRLSSGFLEEPGKTKTVKLIRLAEPKVLSGLDHGQPVLLTPKKRSISVIQEDNTYLGSLPDDISQRLLRFIRGGNRYQALIKAVDRHQLEIFIQETFRSQKFKNTPSFTSSGVSYIPFLSPETIHEGKPEVSPTGEEETTE